MQTTEYKQTNVSSMRGGSMHEQHLTKSEIAVRYMSVEESRRSVLDMARRFYDSK